MGVEFLEGTSRLNFYHRGHREEKQTKDRFFRAFVISESRRDEMFIALRPENFLKLPRSEMPGWRKYSAPPELRIFFATR